MTNEGHCGEADFEQLGRQPTGINQSIHYCDGTYRTHYSDPFGNPGPPLSGDFHRYAAQVYSGHADFFVDGAYQTSVYGSDVALGGINLVYPSTFHISLNVGTCWSWARCPPPNAPPADLVVDWFRVFAYRGDQTNLG